MGNAGKAAKLLHHSLVASGYRCSLDEGSGLVTIDLHGGRLGFDSFVIEAKFNDDLSGTLCADHLMEVPPERRGAILEECNFANDMLRRTKFYIGGNSQLCCSIGMPYAPISIESAYRDALRYMKQAIRVSCSHFAKAADTHASSEDESNPDDNPSRTDETLSFTAIDEDGKQLQCHALFLFEHEDRNIIVFTDESEDDEGNTRVFASRYNPKDLTNLADGDLCALPMEPITHESDWKAVEALLARMQDEAASS